MTALQADAVVDTWGTLIPSQASCAEEVYNIALGHIQSVIKVGQGPWSSIEIRKAEVSGGRGLIGVFSGKRERLVAKWDNYKIYICSRPYGTDLDVNWSLTFEPGYLQKLVVESTGIVLSSLSAFQLEDMRAFVSVIHHGVITVCRNYYAASRIRPK